MIGIFARVEAMQTYAVPPGFGPGVGDPARLPAIAFVALDSVSSGGPPAAQERPSTED